MVYTIQIEHQEPNR